MGNLYYGTSTTPLVMPDRFLSHIKVVIATKLRRGESFTLSWTDASPERGRSTIWLQPSIPLRFVFDSPEPAAIDPEYLRHLADQANTSGGVNADFAEASHTATGSAFSTAA